MVVSCCGHTRRHRRCVRNDGKTFKLPRRFSRTRCLKGPIKGFTMRSSCAPYKGCTRKKKTTYFERFDVYSDANPSDTIPIKYSTVQDVKNTINKLEKLYKSNQYSHARITQVAMILMVRLRIIAERHPGATSILDRLKLANRYFKFLKKRTTVSGDDKRMEMVFKL